MAPVKLIVAGAGIRGRTYAEYAAQYPEKAQIVGVAEPREWYRESLAEIHNIPRKYRFKSWEEIAQVPKFADAVIIGMQDRLHVEPTETFAAMGYHLLLEKPMAPDAEGCHRIMQALRENGVICATGHILRYHNATRLLKEIIDSGALGEIVAVQHSEPVWYWHMAHGFVRGNWRNETETSPLLLQKSCHDIDWLRYIIGKPCTAVSSFGSRQYFRAEERPENAADRCVDCPSEVEAACPYSAQRIYYRFLHSDNKAPVEVLVPNPTMSSLETALREGPYGRCVFACDNDVVDHQVVNLVYEGGATAAFTMTGFGSPEGRKTSIHGTRGSLECNAWKMEVYDFLLDKRTTYEVEHPDPFLDHPRKGSSYRLMENFIDAVAADDPARIIANVEESYESCLAIFAAERARHQNTVEYPLNPFKDKTS